jgi:uncharacterized protein YqgC (DUF456 family)
MFLQIAVYTIAIILSISGLLLTIFTLPGVWLIYIATVLIAVIDNFQTFTPEILIILFLVSLFSTFVDNIISALGVKVIGGSVWGMLGAILGGILGLFVGNIFGIILGPLFGAFLFEFLLNRKSVKESVKAGLGTFLGFLFSVLFKTVINIGLVAYVVINLFF